MSKVVLENVSKIYPSGVKAVECANLEIDNEEFVVFVGPSGCGKSTTLRMVAGLEEISSGKIYIDGQCINDVLPKDRDIAMVFQNYALYPHMTVYKNMAFGLMLRKFPKDEIDRRVREAAHILGMTDDQLQRKPKALSGGQRQRVAVGRAIVRRPKAFLFDEPLSNLDAKMRVQMRAEISKLHTRLSATMIYVTHDQVEAMTMGDRIVVMKDGLIQQVAQPIDLYDSPKNMFVAGFIGSPPMNFFKGQIQKKEGSLWFTEDSAPDKPNSGFSVRVDTSMSKKLVDYIDKPIVFGIRPEDILTTMFTKGAPTDQIVPAKVEVTEPMGAEIYLYLSTNQHHLVARVGPQVTLKVEEEVDLVFDMLKCHFFDPKSELILT